MNGIFKNKKFFPQNFLLTCGANVNVEDRIERICSEAFSISPDSFNGECLYFKFILRYCPPYEQDHFRELKRLQEVAHSKVRFKYEYKGFIAIDISEWADHFNEELFSKVSLAFLCDMSDCWKYIFIINKPTITKEDIRTLTGYFKIKCLSDYSIERKDSFNLFFDSIKDKFNISFSSGAADSFRRFIPEKHIIKKESSLAMEKDIKCYFGTQNIINETDILNYFIDTDSVCYNFIAGSDMEEICRIKREDQRI